MISSYKVRRLMEMDFPEIRHRLGQALQVAQERIRLVRNIREQDLTDWRTCWNASAINDSVFRTALRQGCDTAQAALPDYLYSRTNPRFYSSVAEQNEIAQAYPSVFPGNAERILSDASRACQHRLKVFGYPEVFCGPRIPWRKDIVHKIESGSYHRSQIRYLDFQKVGDSKIVWEPNRHQHLVRLALAYRLTGDNRFAEESFSQWEDWQRENPYLCGINWSSSLESALRAWSWIWMIFLLARSPAATGKRLGQLVRALALHADFIASNLSIYFSPNTHLLGEGFALFVIGLLFPELCSANIYRQTGRTILMQEMQNQVRADGFHAEQSSCYHHYATDFFLCAAILADRNGCSFPTPYQTSLERMVEVMVHTAWPAGTHPMIGDADGGRLLPISGRDPNDHRGTLSIAAVYFGREDFRDRAAKLHEESLWLLGTHAATRFRQLIPKQPRETSKAFRESGTVVMRNNWSPAANMLLFDAGPQGMGNCGHGHADALSIVCSAGGTNWLVDPGTFVYTSSHEDREFFRSTHAHNTLVVDERGQSEPLDTFRWRRVCPARLERWNVLPNLDYASGSHEGYRRLAAPVVHRRHVVFVKPHHWFLMDDVNGPGTHSLEFFFHFAPGTDLQIEKNCCWAAKERHRFFIASDPGIRFEKITGSKEPIQGWYSEDYGHREPAPVLVAKTRCATPRRFSWLLWPDAPDGVRVRQLLDDHSTWALETSTNVEYFAFDGRSGNHFREFTTDADFAFFRQGRDGRMERMTLVGGAYLEHHDGFVYNSEERVEEIDIELQGDFLRVLMHPVKPFGVAISRVAAISLNGQQVEFRRNETGIEVHEGT